MAKQGTHLLAKVTRVSAHRTLSTTVLKRIPHKKYGKRITRSTTRLVHDDLCLGKAGDIVMISPCGRISKNKTWKLVKVVK